MGTRSFGDLWLFLLLLTAVTEATAQVVVAPRPPDPFAQLAAR